MNVLANNDVQQRPIVDWKIRQRTDSIIGRDPVATGVGSAMVDEIEGVAHLLDEPITQRTASGRWLDVAIPRLGHIVDLMRAVL